MSSEKGVWRFAVDAQVYLNVHATSEKKAWKLLEERLDAVCMGHIDTDEFDVYGEGEEAGEVVEDSEGRVYIDEPYDIELIEGPGA